MTIIPRQRVKGAVRLTGKSTFVRKHAGYFFGWQQDKHREQWGFEGFRALTITPSETRIANMIDAQREITEDRAPALFLYSTLSASPKAGPSAMCGSRVKVTASPFSIDIACTSRPHSLAHS